MCELCLSPLSRRRVLGLAGAATAAMLLGRPDPAAAASALQTGYGVAIEPRATWAGDDRPILEVPADEDVKFLLVHHTAGPSQGDPIQLIRQVYDFHTGPDKGWPDVAYNFFVEPGGRVFEGRAGSTERAVQASATGGNQGFSQLVCLIGDFTSRNPTDAQLASLNATLAWLADRYGLSTAPGASATFTSRGSNKWSAGTEVTADTISGHREMSATACPGDTFFPYLKSSVQAEVDALRGNPPSTDPGEPSETTATSSVAPSTSAPQLEDTAASPSTTAPATTTMSASTVPPTVADGTAISPPAPRADESAVAGPEQSETSSGRTSSDSTALALGAGAVAVVAAAAVYVGVRGRDDAERSTPDGEILPPPPGGGDPLR